MKTMLRRRVVWLIRYFIPFLLVLGGNKLSAESNEFAPATVGHWEGTARIIVTWAKQTQLHVTLKIEADGKVTGRVGDANLTNARLKKNRGWIGQNLKVKTDYIVVGELKGPIVAAEGISRSRIKISLNLSAGALAGGIHTSGAKFGGKDQMILSASNLRLTRVCDR
jgi:hypothetical protein